MRAVVFIFLVLAVQAAICQDFRFSLRNYKAMDGLPQSQVRIMLEDKNGYLWVGTEGGGLARFDGRTFKVYTTLDGLQSNIVNFLHLDRKQNLWIVHPRGLTKFDGVAFRKFEQPEAKTSTTRLRRVFEYKDTVFFMSSPGYIGKIYNDSVYYWSRPFFSAAGQQEKQLINFACQIPDGPLLFCVNKETFYLRGEHGDFEINFRAHFNNINNVFLYKNELWFSTENGYMTLDLKNRTMVKRTIPIKNEVMLYDDHHDVFWTWNKTYLLKEKIEGDNIRIDTVMREIDISQVLVDSEGNTWLGTDAAGLFKYFVQDFDRISPDGLTSVMAIFVDSDGARWIGSGTKGLWKIHKGKITTYSTPPGSNRNGFYYITQSPDGVVWVGSIEGLGRYDKSKDAFTWMKPNKGSRFNGVLSIQFDDKNGMWVGVMGGGVAYYDGEKFSRYSIDDGLDTEWIMALLYSSKYKTLFVGDEFGLNTIRNNVVSPVDIPGLRNTSVVSLSPMADSVVLISTGGVGLILYKPDTKFVKYITTKDGLPSDFIYFGAQDEKGYLWVGTEKGITRIKLNAHYEIIENLHFDYDNGLQGVETNQHAYYFDGEEKYFGLVDGLYQYNENKRETNKSYGVHLTHVEIFYGQFGASAFADTVTGFFKIPYQPSLPPDKNHLTFHFNKVDKRHPKSVKFRYQLEGFDKHWSLASSTSEVTYSNLPPGKYVFKVMGSNTKGGWDTALATYPFSIQRPFYNTAWFYVLGFLFVGAVVGLIVYLRIRHRIRQVMMLERFRIKEQENLRKEIARDFHDEMGNQLTRIINYISLLRLKSEEVEVSNEGDAVHHNHDLYNKVEDSAKYLYTGTRDFIWSIDPGNDELSKLFIHIRDFGEKLFEEKDIKFRAYNEVKEKVKLPYGFSREANLIFKEAMTNAFKYSYAQNVSFTLKKAGEQEFDFGLEDDGIGFSTGLMDETSNGLKNIRERADKIGAVLRISTKPGEGTRITLSFTPQHKIKRYGLTL